MKWSCEIPEVMREYVKTNPFFDATSTVGLADLFGVSEETIREWKKRHPDFREAIEELSVVTVNRVQSSLLKSALGHMSTERKVNTSPDGEKTVQVIEKEIEPVPASIRFWLTNRRPDEWKEKQELRQTGETTSTVVIHDRDLALL